MKALKDWLDDLLAARSGTHEHVLTALLDQLGRMPLKGPVLKQVGANRPLFHTFAARPYGS